MENKIQTTYTYMTESTRFPAEEQESGLTEARKVSHGEKEKDTCEGKESVLMRERKGAPNQLSNNQLTERQKNKERETRSAYENIRMCFSPKQNMRNRNVRSDKNIPDYTCSEEDSL